ncbi:hypothetical protein SDC9_132794 [bioreactor metagenome]|uniref:Uncharacterized protein n=1 Tax=bioreactor metagenome TaxID=1076179 RepID=A0A645D9W2_9ZZZZ
MAAQAVAGGVQGVRIDDLQLFGERRFAGQGERFGDEGGAALALRLQQAAAGGGEAFRPLRGAAGGDFGGGAEDQRRCQALAGFPGVERVGLEGQEQRQLFGRVVEFEIDRRREVAQQRGHRLVADVVEDEGLAVGGQLQGAFAAGDQFAGFGK